MHYLRIYADASDASHFADTNVATDSSVFAPPAPTLNISPAMPASQVFFAGLPAVWDGDWHPTPRRQFFAVLRGGMEFEVSDGEVRRVGPGDVVLLEGTTGRGHRSSNLASEETFLLMVQIPD